MQKFFFRNHNQMVDKKKPIDYIKLIIFTRAYITAKENV